MRAAVYILGDIHGELLAMRRLLRDAELISDDWHWIAGDAVLWFTGDFFDRGDDGVGAVDLVMRLQEEAAAAGGSVNAVLGNHDVMILAARMFGIDAGPEWGDTFMRFWMQNGGQFGDLGNLTDKHVEWLTALPLMAKVGNALLAHADSVFYLDYGRSIVEVNNRIGRILKNEFAGEWHDLIERFTQRQAFSEGPAGTQLAKEFLATFEAERLVHGHSPIPLVSEQPASGVDKPLVYADGLCVNVDAGLFMGAPGFVYELPDE